MTTDACYQRVDQIMQRQGGEVSLKIFPGMWHVWQLFTGLFPEADLSVAQLGGFMKKYFICDNR